MSSEPHNTTSVYVTGFVLSLVCTFIPFFLVVYHPITGALLLTVIIGFALLQAAIQLLFFLHLGREKKPYWQSSFLIATVGAVFVVTVGSLWIMNHLHQNMTSVTSADEAKQLVEGEGIAQIEGVQTGACEGVHTNHKVVIKDGKVSPYQTTAHKCDTLTFINKDSQTRDMAFGEHPNHVVYAGLYELIVSQSRPKTFTLSELGTYNFHDHLDETTAGGFTVTP